MAPKTRTRSRLAEITAVGLLSAGLASGGTYAVVTATQSSQPVVVEAAGTVERPGTAEATTTQAAYAPVQEWTDIAAQVTPSVVSIETLSAQGGGEGSGVVWDGEGRIVTNAHVIAGAEQVRVTLSDGRAYEAEVTGSDSATDLAVLTLVQPPGDLAPIVLGDDQELGVGDPVMAVGNPLGLSGTVTTGIVSALDRPVTTQTTGAEATTASVTNAVQTSAAINPGNSGGALVDARGHLVGINSAIASLSSGAGGQSGSIGIGFAIPVVAVTSIVDQLIEDGTAEHAFLGVQLSDEEALVDGATLTGAGVAVVEDSSPAVTGGIEAGDLIVEIDGERVSSAEALVAQVRERTTGAQVSLGIVRDGERSDVDVTLDTRPDEG